MKALPDITVLQTWFSYCAQTGEFTWRSSPHPRIVAGQKAGAKKSDGYVHVVLQKQAYPAHRVAWKLHYGVDPEKQIDHINGARADNRIDNLRLATSAQNHQNRALARTNTSGYPGVYFDKKWGFWCARIRAFPERIFLGCFKTAADAHAAYVEAKKQLHTFHSEVPQR